MKIYALVAILVACAVTPAMAQVNKRVVPTCGSASFTTGDYTPGTVDTTGAECVTGGSSGTVTPGMLTIVPLDVATVTTGGTAVTALNAGHRNKGGFLTNPSGATVALCINEQTTASGTTTAGGLICIPPGWTYQLQPSALGVSVVTSDSSHPFGGEGFN
jgi:hypothetical protein